MPWYKHVKLDCISCGAKLSKNATSTIHRSCWSLQTSGKFLQWSVIHVWRRVLLPYDISFLFCFFSFETRTLRNFSYYYFAIKCQCGLCLKKKILKLHQFEQVFRALILTQPFCKLRKKKFYRPKRWTQTENRQRI